MDIVGYVVYYQGTYGTTRFAPRVSQSLSEQSWPHVAQEMLAKRPEATVCIEPVNKIPYWINK